MQLANKLLTVIEKMARHSAESKAVKKKFNGWGDSIVRTFIPHVRYFSQALSERILPAFGDIEASAERSYEQYTSKRVSDDVEYGHMRDVRQSVVNLYAVGLRHLFEQQFSYLVMRLVDDYERKADYKEDEKVIIDAGEIDIKRFRSWTKLEELEYVCNAVKHAEGKSAKYLEKVRPDLFDDPSCLDLTNGEFPKKRLAVREPLSGDNIYLQETDIKAYAAAIEDFWKEFIEILENYRDEA